jgi:hypothetical protein
MQYPKGSDSFCFQATPAIICLMTLLGEPLCCFAIFACQKWQNVLFRAWMIVIVLTLYASKMLDVGRPGQ